MTAARRSNAAATPQQHRSNTAATARSNGDARKVLDPRSSNGKKLNYTDPDWPRFWEVYPVRRGKLEAYAAWMRYVVAAGEDVDAVIAAATAYRDAPYRDPEHSKWAQGWLSKRRWEDEAAVARPVTAADTAPVYGSPEWEAQQDAEYERIRAQEAADA